MKKKIAAICFLSFTYPLEAVSWEVRSHYSEANTVNIAYRGKSLENLNSVLRSLPPTKKLGGINLRRLVKIESENIQKDIMYYLKKEHPAQLEEAVHSAGNMHNPKIKAIRNPLKHAVLNSGYIKEINIMLNNICYTIEGISFEKLFIIKSGNVIKFDALTWLTVKQLTNRSSSCA